MVGRQSLVALDGECNFVNTGVLDHIEVESVPEVPDDPCSDFLIGSASDLLEMA
jgi:hypothetical protein